MSHSMKFQQNNDIGLTLCFLIIIIICSIFIPISAIEFITPCYAESLLHSLCIAPSNCSVSLTASRLTADKSVIHWVIGNCVGALPTAYTLEWYPIGKQISEYNGTTINSSMASDYYYTITGLLSNTKYFIVLRLRGQEWCTTRVSASYSAISETLTSGEVNHVYLNSFHVLSEACGHLCSTQVYASW